MAILAFFYKGAGRFSKWLSFEKSWVCCTNCFLAVVVKSLFIEILALVNPS